jgi:hypothetical protein
MENNNFKYRHTIILYLLSEGYKAGVINERERINLKQLIMTKHPVITNIMQKYEKDGKVEQVWKRMKEIVSQLIDCENISEFFLEKESGSESNHQSLSSGLSTTVDIINQFSSPFDSALQRQKHKKVPKNSEKEFKEKSEESIKEASSKTTNPAENKFNSLKSIIKKCEKGFSPKTIFKKKYDNDDEDDYF